MTFALALAVALSFWETAQAHDPDEPELEVPEVAVIGQKPVAASSQQFIPDKEIVLQPQGRPAQILRLIPGMLAVEHSGGAGKADQYFLRGFDADHGTDVAFFTDGMPINLRSHAHGQGYTDLNFIIPETIAGLDVYKGAYLPEIGDFATAGAVNFRTRQVVQEGIAQATGGQFDTQRYLLMFSPTKERVRTLFAGEIYGTNGPFINDNNYIRSNVLGKITGNFTGRDEISLTTTFLYSNWDGSGEIPQRAVFAGMLDRFGSVDPSEGGNTLRSTGRLNYHYDTLSGGQFFANAYGQYYRLDLFTNFTFFLNDPVNGDGFAQFDPYSGNDRISDEGGRCPRQTGDANDENLDRHDGGQRCLSGVLCAVCQGRSAAHFVDATGRRVTLGDVYLRREEPLLHVRAATERKREFRHSSAENEHGPGTLGPNRILCQLWGGVPQ
jgi:hypothetical protein